MPSNVIDVIKKVAIYARVSTVYQIDKDSLPFQKDDLVNYAKYAIGIDDFEIFEDAGYSAKNTDRPAYQKMMTRLRSGEFSHLLVWKIDRISRNLIDFAEMYDEMKKIGVVFVSKNEQFDTSTAMGEAMLKIILIFAELERKMTSERVSAILLSRAEKGQWNGGRIPFGYHYDEEKMEFSIDYLEGSIAKSIYDKYEEFRSFQLVARYLNDKNLKPRSGIPWNPTTIGLILKSPFYYGAYRYNYHDLSGGSLSWQKLKPENEWIVFEEHHPEIVSYEQWLRVQNIISGNKRNKFGGDGATYTRKNIHIFSGLLRCGACGSNMPATVDRARSDGYRPSIYLCSRHRRYDDCENKYISDIVLGPFVINYIANIMRAQENIGRSTPIETFERKLLRGNAFDDVSSIEYNGLYTMYEMMKSGKVGNEVYTSKLIKQDTSDSSDFAEAESLQNEKRKKERALARLKSLYLYDETAIPEKEFILEKKRLLDEISDIDKKLEYLENDDEQSVLISDDEFIKKASYFIMNQKLTDKRFVNFDTFIRNVDSKIVKEFINSIIKKIVIYDGKIVSITFKNGIEHKFLYKSV